MRRRAPEETRERILAAAAAILAEEGVGARLTVRAVTTRSGVSVGAMRHHFPTQADLRDELMRRIGDWMAPDEWIDDTALPADARLHRSLGSMLAQVGTGAQARASMTRLVATFVDVEQSAQVRAAHRAVEEDGQRRIAGWLRTLASEGHLESDDIPRQVRFLGAVLGGLALQRALPTLDAQAQIEHEVLEDAVATVLRTSRGSEHAHGRPSA